MVFYKTCLAFMSAGLAAASAIPKASSLQARDQGSCTGGPWVDPTYVGGYTEGESIDFCETGYPSYGHPINTISIWSGGEVVRGIQFGYDDPYGQPSQLYGTNAGDEQTITIDYAGGELISTVAMFSADGGKYLRGLTIETSKGQVVHGGVTKDSGIPYYLQDVGTGYLIGSAGAYETGVAGPYVDGAIDQIGFLFLNSPVASISVTDLVFNDGPAGTQGIVPMSLANQHFYNGDTTSNDTWQFSGSKAVTSTSTYVQSSSSTFTGSYAFMLKGSLFSIVDASDTTTFMWATMDGEMTTTTRTEVDTLGWQQGGTLAPGQGITCSSVAGHGSGTFPYTSTVTITLQSGAVYAQYNEQGNLQIDDVSSNSVSCVPDNTPSK